MRDPAATQAALAELIARLRGAEIDWDAENIADLVWLSRYMDGTAVPRSTSSSQSSSTASIRRQTDFSDPTPLPPPEPEIGLYAGEPQTRSAKSTPANRGIPFQAPTAPALRKTLAIGRALRPLMRKVNSYTQQVLDEEATAEQTAEQRFCMTVVQPAKERWLEVALVIEDSAASFLWQETIRDFKQVLERQGAFRSITVWHLQTTQGDIKLFAQAPSRAPQQSSRSLKELIDASGRRLILLVSDCISSAWRTGAIHRICLELWAAHSPLAIVQLLPGHLWSRTVLSAGLEVQLGAWVPGATNQQLLFQEPPIGAAQNDACGLKIPTVTLEPNSLTRWAKMVAGWGESWATGIWFDEGWQTLQVPQPSAESLTAEQLVQRFTTTASEMAKRLAGLMALVPVNLPIIYLLQETMLPESTPLHLAEIFMSGLIERENNSADTPEEKHPRTTPTYDFVEDVREPLLDSVPTPLKEEVLDRVSQYIGKKLNRSIYSFTALLQLEKELGEAAGSDLLKFATLAKQVLQRMGGDYAALVDILEQPGPPPSPLPPLPNVEFPPLRTMQFMQAQVVDQEDLTEPETERAWPPFQTDSFTIATVVVEAEPESGLELFEFKIATLEQQQSQQQGLFGRLFGRQTTEWVINERRGQARRFIDVLNEQITPDLSLERNLRQRLQLVQLLNALPEPQFAEVLFALNPAPGVIPPQVAAQGTRVAALLDWAESSVGPGLDELQNALHQIDANLLREEASIPGTILEMVSIPGGSFTMGSPRNELERTTPEGPQHEVTIQPFFMGRYPVTQAQWRFVAGLEKISRELGPDPSQFKGDNRPVEQVSWYEAVEFCDRLSRHIGREYRLPTEAEWEYACRAGTTAPFHFGETITTDIANYDGNYVYGNGPKGQYRKETLPVDYFDVANAFGLSDMHGNVWEWCQDHWHGSYEGAPTDSRAWLSNDEGVNRVRRGGSWNLNPRLCRSAYRDLSYPAHRYNVIGFRVVCSAPRALQ